jgi:hypothetical protein
MIPSFLLFVLRCGRWTLSARLLVEWRPTRYEKLILFIIPILGKPFIPRRLGFLQDGSDVSSIYSSG